MIGLSITDPNLRRLLDITNTKFEKPKHFAIMKRGPFDNLKDKTAIGKNDLEKITMVNQELLENFFKTIGVNVIWVEDHDEIPNIIDIILVVAKLG